MKYKKEKQFLKVLLFFNLFFFSSLFFSQSVLTVTAAEKKAVIDIKNKGNSNIPTTLKYKSIGKIIRDIVGDIKDSISIPSKDTPSKDTPSKDTPSKDTSSKDTPSNDTPSKDTPSKDTSSKNTPSTGTPAADTPAVDAPAAGTPAANTPSTDTPAVGTPSEGTPPVHIPINEKAKNIINKIEGIVSTIGESASPNDSMNSILGVIPDVSSVITKENNTKVIDEFDKALDAVSKSYSDTPTLDTASTVSKIIKELGINTISTPRIAEKIDDLYKNLINSSDTLIEKASDNDTLSSTIKDIISNTSSVIKSKSADASSDMNKIVRKAAEKVGEKTLEAVSDGTKVTVDISNTSTESIIETAAEVSNLVDNLEDTLKANKIQPEKINKTIKLKIPSTEKAKDIVTILPGTMFGDIRKTGVESINIASEVANISISPNNIIPEEADRVSIHMRKLDKPAEPKPEEKNLYSMENIYEFKTSLIDQAGNDKKLSTVNKPFIVEIPYTLKEGENPDNLVICVYVEDDEHLENPNDKSKLNTWQPVGGKYDPVRKAIRFSRSSFSMYSIVQVNRSFSDLLKYDWARKEIETMSSKGIISGKSSKEFDPASNITRAEFSGLIVRTLGILDTKAKVTFEDVNPEDWYYTVVASAFKAGIIQGKSADKFEPNAPITRQEMMQITSNAMVKVLEMDQEEDTDQLNKYADNSLIASWAKKSVAMNIKLGIVKGNPNYSIAPTNKAIRAEAAVIIKRLYDLM